MIPFGLLAAGLFWTRQFSVLATDAPQGRSPGVMRLRWARTSQQLDVLVAGAFVALAFLPTAGLSQNVWFGVAALPLAVGAARKLGDQPGCAEALIPGRKMMIESIVVFAVTAGGGLLIASL
jgi:1,4-dihydroxy-2-naphthoate octaprenyltransferase